MTEKTTAEKRTERNKELYSDTPTVAQIREGLTELFKEEGVACTNVAVTHSEITLMLKNDQSEEDLELVHDLMVEAGLANSEEIPEVTEAPDQFGGVLLTRCVYPRVKCQNAKEEAPVEKPKSGKKTSTKKTAKDDEKKEDGVESSDKTE